MSTGPTTNDQFQQLLLPAEPSLPLDTPALAGQRVGALLDTLDEAASESGLSAAPRTANKHENRLIQARLGIASGLFAALRAKHQPTASHCLRVALGCSSWSEVMNLTDDDRDALEVAALLHDIGKIGVPDKVLMKPGRLLPEEMELMSRQRQTGVQILAAAGAPASVLEIISHVSVWFEKSAKDQQSGDSQMSLLARMLAIVDAFDAMTTDHVYRPAKSRERALNELFQFSGTQFDPDLVKAFCELFSRDQNLLTQKVARRWLHELQQTESQTPWGAADGQQAVSTGERLHQTHHLFEEKLIDNMHDGVIFVDSESKIFLWNTGAERLTGVGGTAACGRVLRPTLLDMCDESGKLVADEECPIARAISSGVQSMQRLGIVGRNGQRVSVDLHAIPALGSDGVVLGATVLLHDASSETSLEEKCQALHAQVTKDPMTQVANRAEFDRMQALFIEAHQQTGLPCSLIMTDIDHFKSVNDTYGHQAGDEAIISMASLLKSLCRSGDLVARYGGEEFAVLCADCSNAAAAQRAENIRKKLSEQTFSFLGNKNITASFGVTELQPGDTPDTMLRRADRALLQAKDQGRNQVVQLGDGMHDEKETKSWWPFKSWRGQALIDVQLYTTVPLEVAIQKLRGFIADHEAKIVKTDENELRLELNDFAAGKHRRRGDRPQCFTIELKFSEKHIERSNSQGLAAGRYLQTNVAVTIRPRRDRDRRKESTTDRARLLLGSLKSYLMAKETELSGAEPQQQLEAVAD